VDIRKKKYRISMLHSTELKKVYKLKWPSEEVSVTLGREESNHKGGWGVRKGPGRKSGQWRGGLTEPTSSRKTGHQMRKGVHPSVITLTCNCSCMKE
jgi:hypothetical protein